MLLSGCVRKECEEKVKDLEFTVTKEEELPEALRQQIEEKKEGDFRFTYSDNEYLYVARGYGIQETGGYSISVYCIEAGTAGGRGTVSIGYLRTIVKSLTLCYTKATRYSIF